MNKISLAASLVTLLIAVPSLSSADPRKDESGNGRGYEKFQEHSNKYKNKHKHKGDDDKEVIYVYKERPQEEVVVIEKESEYSDVDSSKDVRRPRSVSTAIEDGNCNRDRVGTVLGGVVGGVVGYQLGKERGNEEAGTVLGAIAGAVIGNRIGKNMDKTDRQCTAQTLEHAKDGQTVSWRNPDNGVNYKMTPLNSYLKDDRECRQYVAVAASDKTKEEQKQEACKQPDGRWEVSKIDNRL